MIITFINNKKKSCMLWGLPWLAEELGSYDEPQMSNPTSTGGFPSFGT
jgi:hypothetical protein